MKDSSEQPFDRQLRGLKRQIERNQAASSHPGGPLFAMTQENGPLYDEWQQLCHRHEKGGEAEVFQFFYDVQMLRDASLFFQEKDEYRKLGFERKLKEFAIKGDANIQEIEKSEFFKRKFSGLIHATREALNKAQAMDQGTGIG